MSSVEAVIYFENDGVAGCGFPKTTGVKSLLQSIKKSLRKRQGRTLACHCVVFFLKWRRPQKLIRCWICSAG
jgi:hypothetical protein